MTTQDQQAVARRAEFYFDCYFGLNTEDSVVFTGDGVDDLDALAARLQAAFQFGGTNVNSRFQCEVGSQYSSWRPFDLEDVAAIRSYYVQFYGEVNKPDAYRSPASSAVQL